MGISQQHGGSVHERAVSGASSEFYSRTQTQKARCYFDRNYADSWWPSLSAPVSYSLARVRPVRAVATLFPSSIPSEAASDDESFITHAAHELVTRPPRSSIRNGQTYLRICCYITAVLFEAVIAAIASHGFLGFCHPLLQIRLLPVLPTPSTCEVPTTYSRRTHSGAPFQVRQLFASIDAKWLIVLLEATPLVVIQLLALPALIVLAPSAVPWSAPVVVQSTVALLFEHLANMDGYTPRYIPCVSPQHGAVPPFRFSA